MEINDSAVIEAVLDVGAKSTAIRNKVMALIEVMEPTMKTEIKPVAIQSVSLEHSPIVQELKDTNNRLENVLTLLEQVLNKTEL